MYIPQNWPFHHENDSKGWREIDRSRSFRKSNKLYSRSLYSRIRPRLRSVDSQTKAFQHHLKFKFARKVGKGVASVTFNITSRVIIRQCSVQDILRMLNTCKISGISFNLLFPPMFTWWSLILMLRELRSSKMKETR